MGLLNLVEEKEKKAKGRSLAWLIALKDKELVVEQKWEMSNVCPKCRLVLTKRGICPMDC